MSDCKGNGQNQEAEMTKEEADDATLMRAHNTAAVESLKAIAREFAERGASDVDVDRVIEYWAANVLGLEFGPTPELADE